jgi:hypothetical protein
MFSFLNAGILIAALATLIPLLIHLFIKNKPKQVIFSSLKFLKEIVEERKRRMTFNQLLLLILRMLVILFIVFSLAKPVLKLPFIQQTNYHPPTAVAFILDTSPSMDYVIDQKTQIQHGIDIIRNIQSEMTQQDISLLFTSDFIRNSLSARVYYGLLPENDLSNISFTWTPEPLSNLISKAAEELEKTRFLHTDIYVISDFNTNEIINIADIHPTPLFISTFTDSLRMNLSTEKVIIKREPIDGSVVRIAEFEVVNNSPLPVRDQVVRLNLNGTTIAEKMLDFLPRERKTDFFVINHENLEWNSGFVEVRNERFLPDNRYYFTFYSDPKPIVAIVSNRGNLPRPLSVLAEIFVGRNGESVHINPETVSISDMSRYHLIIFNLDSYSSRIQALVAELRKNNLRSMFILPPSLDEGSRNFLQSTYGLEVIPQNIQLSPITAFHQWHRIVGSFDFRRSSTLLVKPANQINTSRNNIPLVSTDRTPIIVENSDIFINIDFSVNQNFLAFPAFPVLVYRSFSWISIYDNRVNDFFIGDRPDRTGILISPTGTEYDTNLAGFKFDQPGIWNAESTNRKLPIAINISDFENQSRFIDRPNIYNNAEVSIAENSDEILPPTQIDIFREDYLSHVLSTDRGFEIWKALLLAVFLLLAMEMGLVLFLQKGSATS